MTTQFHLVNDKSTNISDDELIIKEYIQKCNLLETENNKKNLIKQNLLILNKKNEKISKSLLSLKKEYDIFKYDLMRTLFYINVTSDKQKILSKKTLHEYSVNKKNCEEQYKKLPFFIELEGLINENNSLLGECQKLTALLENTKIQYDEMMKNLLKTFKMKICEFCDVILKYKKNNS